MDNALMAAIEKYLVAIKADYAKFNGIPEMMERFNSSLTMKEGRNYIKIVSSGSAHTFIVKEDGQFKKGDILKASSWSMPAKNAARGNIFDVYNTSWTGAPYMYR